MKIYVASSWRNRDQALVVQELRLDGHDVYDFKNPEPGDNGFHWSEIDPAWKAWSPDEFRHGLMHPIAVCGFRRDFSAMKSADLCVLVLPCGRSAHLEAGWFSGSGKRVYVLMRDQEEPELMYSLTTQVCTSIIELRNRIGALETQ